MPTFPTPEPIPVTVEVCGDIRIAASDRIDTVVTVRPANPAKPADVRAAEQITVELNGDRLDVRSTQGWLRYTPFGGNGSVHATVELPTGSTVTATSALGAVITDGELGECRLKSAMGDIRVDQAGPLRASSGHGDIAVERVIGDADVSTGSGDVHVDDVRGAALVKSSNGDITVGTVTGDLRIKASNGDVAVGRAGASATAKTANGDVRVAEVASGTVVLETAAGDVEVGVRDGTAVWLDVVTRFGNVRNALDTASAPPSAPTGANVEIRARTSVGDIVINRSSLDRPLPIEGSDAR